ncbi:MAG: NAD-dependent malic enzyme, partial [Aeromonas sp.]
MLMAASRALAECSPLAQGNGTALLPDLADIQQVSRHSAQWVAKTALLQGKAVQTSDEVIEAAIDGNFWQPEYRRYRRTSF